MEAYDATGAGRRLQTFIDDLSSWYVRRCRRRFWNAGGTTDADTMAAFRTLHRCLTTLAQLLAPFTPFVADAIWRNLAAGRAGRPDSVHLSDYPVVAAHELDPGLDEAMATARSVVELGRRVRTDTGIRTRQPLAEAVVAVPGHTPELTVLLPIIGEELNVKRVRMAGAEDAFGTWRAKPDFKVLGPRLGARVQALAAALGADDGDIADRLARGVTVDVPIDDGPAVTIGPDDVELTLTVLAGWGVASDSGITVALELEVTSELRLEGLARELVRLIQDARRDAGLDVSDRIELAIDAEGSIAAARDAHASFIARETLATLRDVVEDASHRASAELDDQRVGISVRVIPAERR
jgi:isoleucyl-tRNA synthetase